jgi:hypothetical protein
MFLKLLLLLNLLALNTVVIYHNLKPAPPIPAPICQSVCPTIFIPSPTPAPLPLTPSSSPVTHQAPTSKTRHVGYFPIPGSGSQLAYDWYTLPSTDFYFDPADFPGLKEIFFEANIHLLNGNGTAFVRLFDTTNKFIVQNSQIQTSNQTSTAVVSQPVTFHSGKSLIKVQVKSLTADTAIFDSGRLKIISEY